MRLNGRERKGKYYAMVVVVLLCSSVITGTILYFDFKNSLVFEPMGINFIIVVNESSHDFPELYLKPEKIEINPNETAIVNVVLVNGSSVAVVDVGIEYNEHVVEILNVSSKYRFNYSKGYIHDHFVVNVLNLKIFLNESIKNSSVIANITLMGQSNGETRMGFTDYSELYDKRGRLMNRKLFGSTITVGMPSDNTKVHYDFVELIIFIITFAVIPILIIFIFVAFVVRIVFILISKIKRKKFEDLIPLYLAITLMATLLVYIVYMFLTPHTYWLGI